MKRHSLWAWLATFGVLSVALAEEPPSRDYKVTVPVICCDMNRQGGRQKVIDELHRLGAARVLLACDWYQRDPDRRRKLMALLKDHAAAFHREGFEVGAWTWSLHCTDISGFTPMTASDGWVSKVDPCPADPDFLSWASGYVADLARTGVDMILFDDDFGFSFKHDEAVLCTCERHLERIRKRVRFAVTPEELKAKAMSGGPNPCRDAWLEVKGETLCNYARTMRRAVDAVNPQVRLGQCVIQSLWDFDGVDAVSISRILAGANRPFLRLIGAPYWAMLYGKEGLERLHHVVEYTRMQRSWCADDVEIVGEGDVYPRPRWHCPASYLELFDLALRADGRFDGLMKYGLDYHSKLSDEPGYVARHVRNRELALKVSRAFADKRPAGVRIVESMKKIAALDVPDDLKDNLTGVGKYPDSLWLLFRSPAAKMMSDCGIPTVYGADGLVTVAFGPNASELTDADMKKGVITDAWGADLLRKRGIDVGIRGFGGKTSVSREIFEGDDIVCQERFKARQMTLDARCEVDSRFLLDCSFLEIGKESLPASYYYENRDGGRFFVLAFDAYYNGQGMNRSYPRARQLRRMITRLSQARLPAFVDGNPDLYVMAKKSASGEMAVGLWNCFSDEAIAPVVELDDAYSSIEFLGCRGRLEGNRVILEDVPAWKFAGFRVSHHRAVNGGSAEKAGAGAVSKAKSF